MCGRRKGTERLEQREQARWEHSPHGVSHHGEFGSEQDGSHRGLSSKGARNCCSVQRLTLAFGIGSHPILTVTAKPRTGQGDAEQMRRWKMGEIRKPP